MTDPQGPAPVDLQELVAALTQARSEELRQALTRLESTREALAAAQVAVEASRDAAHLALRRFGAAHVEAQDDLPVELLRELYWDHPELHVDHMAAAFGMRHPGEVYRRVGPDERALPCRGGCGRSVVRKRKSRTDSTPRRGSQDPRLCPTCREEAAHLEAARDAERDVHLKRVRAENEALRRELEAARDAGLRPTAVYVEYPGVPGTWRLSAEDEVSPPWP